MAHNPEAFAEMVVLTIKAALAPILERLAASEQSNRELSARVQELTSLRDRVTTVEAKAGAVTSTISAAEAELLLRNYLDPVKARLSAVEQPHAHPPVRVEDVFGLPERLSTIEHKSLTPAEPSTGPTVADIEALIRDRLTPVTDRIETLNTQVRTVDARVIEAKNLRDRLTALETKTAPEPPPRTAEIELAMRDQIEPVTKQVATLSERVAVLEVRAPIPGPAGKDGANGKDGADGLGFDDLDMAFDDDRTIEFKLARGARVKSWPFVLPYQKQQGVYVEGQTYVKGDVVTWGGSQWHANETTTTKPGEGLKAWTLIVKRGRDGKDGRDAQQPAPVVSVVRS